MNSTLLIGKLRLISKVRLIGKVVYPTPFYIYQSINLSLIYLSLSIIYPSMYLSINLIVTYLSMYLSIYLGKYFAILYKKKLKIEKYMKHEKKQFAGGISLKSANY